MIVIGLEDCPGCKIFKEKHPELKYLEVPRKADPKDKSMLNIKKSLGRLNITKFPAIVNDGFTQRIDIKSVEPDWEE